MVSNRRRFCHASSGGTPPMSGWNNTTVRPAGLDLRDGLLRGEDLVDAHRTQRVGVEHLAVAGGRVGLGRPLAVAVHLVERERRDLRPRVVGRVAHVEVGDGALGSDPDRACPARRASRRGTRPRWSASDGMNPSAMRRAPLPPPSGRSRRGGSGDPPGCAGVGSATRPVPDRGTRTARPSMPDCSVGDGLGDRQLHPVRQRAPEHLELPTARSRWRSRGRGDRCSRVVDDGASSARRSGSWKGQRSRRGVCWIRACSWCAAADRRRHGERAGEVAVLGTVVLGDHDQPRTELPIGPFGHCRSRAAYRSAIVVPAIAGLRRSKRSPSTGMGDVLSHTFTPVTPHQPR